MTERTFVRGTDWIQWLIDVADPDVQQGINAEADANDRVCATRLALIREAAKQTQAELATELWKSQRGVSQLESRTDMLRCNAP